MVRLIHEVLMEGNCYSWLCRLMNKLSFPQHHTLKIQAGQVVPGGSCPPWSGVAPHIDLQRRHRAGGTGQVMGLGSGRRNQG